MKQKFLFFVAMCLFVVNAAFGQTRSITGQVTSESDGEPLIGVAIKVKGTSTGTATDLNGNFTLEAPANATLEVSYIGYTTKEVRATGTNMRIVLSEDAQLLSDVVVVGYGVQKKSDLTGAVASVRESDLQNRFVADAAAALQGKAAGIQILNNSGAPGSAAKIRVRGYSSNSGELGPLLIVDGLKVDDISYLDPSMIESMEILKDAASAAIYGAEAGNGVVLITTKSGRSGSGRASITYDMKFTNQMLGKKAELFEGDEYVEFQKYIGNINDNLLTANGYVPGMNYNWFDAVFEPSWSQQHSFTFQGGNDKGHYLAALNYLKNDGIVVGKEDVYSRLTGQINADYQIKEWLQIGTNTSIEKFSTKSVTEAAYGSMLNSVMSLDPLTPAYYSNIEDCATAMQQHYQMGDPVPQDPSHNNDFYATSKYLEESTGNPLFQRDRRNRTTQGIAVRGTAYANFTPVKGLTVTSRFGYRISQRNIHNYEAPYWLTGMASSANYTISSDVRTNYYYQWENFANYLNSFGKNDINVMAGMSYIENNWDNMSISSTGPDILKSTAENSRYIDYLKDDAPKTVSNAPRRSTSISYFGRIGYTYDNRYSIQANFRADAFDSSKLSDQKRWGYFPSFSAGWTISNEPFFKNNVNVEKFSFLKIRASWGRNGNVNVLTNYPYSSTIAVNSSWYQYTPADGNGTQYYGSAPEGLANPNLKWETSDQIDAGLDARFFSNRLTFGFDWYRKTTQDLLVEIAPTPEIGVKSTFINAGKVLNTGVEFEIGWKDRVGDFNYSINANLSTLKNTVLELTPVLKRIEGTGGGVSGLNNKIRTAFEEGQPIWYFRGFKYVGINGPEYTVAPKPGEPEYEPGTNQFGAFGKPLYNDKDGKLTSAPSDGDLQYIGKAIPDFTYGITIALEYKGIDFTLFGTGVAGNDIFSLLYSADRSKTNTLTTFWRNSWKQEGDVAKYPDMKTVYSDWTFWSSSASIFNGSFFKFKQIQLGYTLPRNITQKAKVNSLRVYVSLDDFFTITSYPGCDPETATTSNIRDMGYDAGSYPTTKKVILGLNLTF